MSDSPAEIARGLIEAQRKAILWLPVRGWTAGPAYWQVSNTIKALSKRRPPLTTSRPHPERAQSSGSILQWRLTPLGQQVRAELQKGKSDE